MKTEITKTFVADKVGINIKKFPHIIAVPVIEYDDTYPVTISCEGEYDKRDCMDDGLLIHAYSNNDDARKFAAIYKQKIYSFTVNNNYWWVDSSFRSTERWSKSKSRWIPV